MVKQYKLLDCTLRDGGYHNNWDFSDEVVQEYLECMSESGIEYVELGLRNFAKGKFLGAFAYTTEQHLNSLKLPKGPTYGVMIDAKTILSSGMKVRDAVDALFVPAMVSRLSLVRVAAHFSEVAHSGEIVKHLKQLGYKVGFNLMQSGGKSECQIGEAVKEIDTWNSVDVLYFADSLGNMNSEEVIRIVNTIKLNWSGELGIHTHDNMGKGLDNTLIAMEHGVTWLDSTVTGMGRGAGNTQTERLLAVLDNECPNYSAKPVYSLAIKYFEPLQKQYSWGSNLLYFLGARNEVHPMYIQNLLSSSHYGKEEIVGAIDYLNRLDGTASYSEDILKDAIAFNDPKQLISGADDLKNKFTSREVLIVGSGPSLSRYKKAVEAYIEDRKPVVIAINALETLSSEFIDYYAVSHNTKYFSENTIYKDLTKPLILPAHRFSAQELSEMTHYFDYGVSVQNSIFDVASSSCVTPFDLTVAYALAVSICGNATGISLVGLDGYEEGDQRQSEMIELISSVKSAYPNLGIQALTPTTYPVSKGSIYAPSV